MYACSDMRGWLCLYSGLHLYMWQYLFIVMPIIIISEKKAHRSPRTMMAAPRVQQRSTLCLMLVLLLCRQLGKRLDSLPAANLLSANSPDSCRQPAKTCRPIAPAFAGTVVLRSHGLGPKREVAAVDERRTVRDGDLRRLPVGSLSVRLHANVP